MQVRFIIPDDVAVCAQIVQDAPIPLAQPREKAWHPLFAGGHATGVVVEDGGQVIAFGMSLFISEELRQAIITAPNPISPLLFPPYPQNGILRRSKRAAQDAILQAHRDSGLNLVGLYGWREEYADCPALRQVLYQSFHLVHRGYHLASFLKEVYGDREREAYKRLGLECYKAPDKYNPHLRRYCPYLVGIERSQVSLEDRTADLFQPSAPQLHLGNLQRSIIQLAWLCRLNNAQIAECLEMQEVTVQWHWAEMCRQHPQHFCCQSQENGRRGRGAVMRYVAAHPEVMYPLEIPKLFYKKPELARRYPLCLI